MALVLRLSYCSCSMLGHGQQTAVALWKFPETFKYPSRMRHDTAGCQLATAPTFRGSFGPNNICYCVCGYHSLSVERRWRGRVGPLSRVAVVAFSTHLCVERCDVRTVTQKWERSQRYALHSWLPVLQSSPSEPPQAWPPPNVCLHIPLLGLRLVLCCENFHSHDFVWTLLAAWEISW